jgi:transposase
MKKRPVLLSEAQWSVLAPLFPEPKRRKDGRGRPWATNKSCLLGILWVLRTGARWRDLPDEYPDGSTCWRRLRIDEFLRLGEIRIPDLHLAVETFQSTGNWGQTARALKGGRRQCASLRRRIRELGMALA